MIVKNNKAAETFSIGELFKNGKKILHCTLKEN